MVARPEGRGCGFNSGTSGVDVGVHGVLRAQEHASIGHSGGRGHPMSHVTLGPLRAMTAPPGANPMAVTHGGCWNACTEHGPHGGAARCAYTQVPQSRMRDVTRVR